MVFNKKPKVNEISIRPAANGYTIRVISAVGDNWSTVDYVAVEFDELVGVLTQIEVEGGK